MAYGLYRWLVSSWRDIIPHFSYFSGGFVARMAVSVPVLARNECTTGVPNELFIKVHSVCVFRTRVVCAHAHHMACHTRVPPGAHGGYPVECFR